MLFSDSPAQSMNQIMGFERTPSRPDAGAQARALLRVRQAFPGATLRLHARRWGEIVEVRCDGHTIALARLLADGTLAPDARLGRTERVRATIAA
jgi:hypothetical protein